MHRATRRLILAVTCAIAVGALSPAHGEPTIVDGSITSFDGTRIVYHLFLPEDASPENRVPVILMTHGWGGSGQTTYSGDVQLLIDDGYAVLTWDQRGFGSSGGEANIDSQEYEVRDVQALIDMVAARPEIQTDAPGDPRMGMLGSSYAGGIQLMTAAADHRVDAIAPDIAWNDLPYALFPHGVVKTGWDTALYALGAATGTANGLPQGETGALALEIHRGFVEGAATNTLSPETHAWFDARSPKHYLNGATLPDGRVLPGVAAPTLLTQGTIDTLFNLNHAIYSARQIAANGVPVKMMFYCGGHAISTTGGCGALTIGGEHIDQAVLAWFDRYVRGNPAADTGAPIEYQAQDGLFYDAAALPGTTANATGAGTLVNTIVPTSGQPFAAGPSADGFRFEVPVPVGAHLLGIPTATITVGGIGPEASLFVTIVDVDASGEALVVQDQVSPLKVSGLGQGPHTLTIDLTSVAWIVEPGHSIAIEVSPTSVDHASTRTPFVADVEIAVIVPYLVP